MYKASLLFVLMPILLNAQTTIPITGFQNNYLLYNPAAAGENESLDLSVLRKMQWTSFNVNPSVFALSMATPFQYNRYGIGLTIINESSGIQNFLNVNGNFSYKLNCAKGKLAFGLRPGIFQWMESFDKLTIKDDEEGITNATNKLVPSIGGGMYYKDNTKAIGLSTEYTPGIYQGVSVLPKLYVTGMFVFTKVISSSIALSPGLFIRYTNGFNPITTVSFPLEYKKLFWTGLYYRTNSTLAVMGGLNLDRMLKNNYDKISIFYYYDFNASKTANQFFSTHELMLSFQFGKSRSMESIKRKRVTVSPVYFN